MDFVYRPKNFKGLYGILQLLPGSHLDNFPLKTLKLDWVAFHSVTFQLKCSDFQSNQYKKLVPVLSRFCNGLCMAPLLKPRRISRLHCNLFMIPLSSHHIPAKKQPSTKGHQIDRSPNR